MTGGGNPEAMSEVSVYVTWLSGLYGEVKAGDCAEPAGLAGVQRIFPLLYLGCVVIGWYPRGFAEFLMKWGDSPQKVKCVYQTWIGIWQLPEQLRNVYWPSLRTTYRTLTLFRMIPL